jgi:hypothetical protein
VGGAEAGREAVGGAHHRGVGGDRLSGQGPRHRLQVQFFASDPTGSFSRWYRPVASKERYLRVGLTLMIGRMATEGDLCVLFGMAGAWDCWV